MLIPTQTEQADRHPNLKRETVSPWMAFFWLSRVRMICVTCWNHSIGASGGRRVSPAKKTNYTSGRNCNVLQWLVHLVYFHEHNQQ